MHIQSHVDRVNHQSSQKKERENHPYHIVQKVWWSALHHLVTNAATTCTFFQKVLSYTVLYIVHLCGRETSKTENRRMASKSTISLLSFCYFMLFSLMHLSSTATALSWTSHSHTCNGSIAECNQEAELLMESETSRRFLEQRRFISNGALKRDKPVCNGGASGEAYSRTGGCLPPPSNPHNRGCSKYYRCRSDS